MSLFEPLSQIDGLEWVLILIAGAITIVIFLQKFDQLTEIIDWDPPPRFLTSKTRYKITRTTYGLIGLISYSIVYILLGPIAENTDIVRNQLVQSRLAPFVAAFLVTGVIYQLPIVNQFELWARNFVHKLALIPKRSDELVGLINASPIRGELAKNSENEVSEEELNIEREAIADQNKELGIQVADFDASFDSFAHKRLRFLYLYGMLSNTWRTNETYSPFFSSYQSNWDQVVEKATDVKVRIKVYETVSEKEQDETETEVTNFLERLTRYVTYIILSVEPQPSRYVEHIRNLGLAAPRRGFKGIEATPAAFFTVIGLVGIMITMMIMFNLSTQLGIDPFPPRVPINVGLLYFIMTIVPMIAVFYIKNIGIRDNWWPILVEDKLRDIMDKYIFNRPWKVYASCFGLGFGFGVVAIPLFRFLVVPPKLSIDASTAVQFLPMAIFPGLVAMFVAYSIDNASHNVRPLLHGLIQGLVAVVLMYFAALIAFGPATGLSGLEGTEDGFSKEQKQAAVIMISTLGFVVQFGAGALIVKMVRDQLKEFGYATNGRI